MHWMCNDCDRDFASQSALIQHLTNNSAHHYCARCDEDFNDEDDLETHYEEDHHYCCSRIFDNEHDLRQHKNDRHWYCESCDRIFDSENNLDTHLRSSIHMPRRFKCPGARCSSVFVSPAALISHCESGKCPSGVSREAIDLLVVTFDRNNVITNSNRLLKAPDGSYVPPATMIVSSATKKSWNGAAYECVLCHREFRSLSALNSHLQSPAHADKIYRCPKGHSGCGTQFKTLSGLVQHVESGSCGVRKFKKQIDNAVQSVANGLRKLIF